MKHLADVSLLQLWCESLLLFVVTEAKQQGRCSWNKLIPKGKACGLEVKELKRKLWGVSIYLRFPQKMCSNCYWINNTWIPPLHLYSPYHITSHHIISQHIISYKNIKQIEIRHMSPLAPSPSIPPSPRALPFLTGTLIASIYLVLFVQAFLSAYCHSCACTQISHLDWLVCFI